ncbi:MAG TPA: DUF4142 domain-containing protein [Terracidiphilus sp.]|nr:DUF4142 domain-containing protein [Terracidiphilus sp.]
MKFSWIATGASLLFVVAAPGARAQSSQMQHSNASPADSQFVRKAMQGSDAEIKLGQLATEKASSPDVKQFGQRMVEDHTKLNEQMKPVAEQIGVSPLTTVSPKDQALEAKLETLSGDAFDKAYMSAMVKDHTKDLAEFRHEAKDGQSTAVKDAAEQGAHVIHEHLQLAEKVGHEVGAVGTNMSNKTGARNVSTPTGPQ